jgi:hypothetical protein
MLIHFLLVNIREDLELETFIRIPGDGFLDLCCSFLIVPNELLLDANLCIGDDFHYLCPCGVNKFRKNYLLSGGQLLKKPGIFANDETGVIFGQPNEARPVLSRIGSSRDRNWLMSARMRRSRMGYALLPCIPAKKPIALRFMLFAAMRQRTLRPVSRNVSDMRRSGSKNLNEDEDEPGPGSCTATCLVMVGCCDQDEGSFSWNVEGAAGTNLAEEDIYNNSGKDWNYALRGVYALSSTHYLQNIRKRS